MPQLKKHHFIQEEKPIQEDYWEYRIENVIGKIYRTGHFFEDLKDWVSKYVEPELDWASFDDKKPMHNQEIYVADIIDLTYTNDSFLLINYNHNIAGYQLWASKEDYDERLAYYNDHKVLFEDWEQTDFKNRFIHQKNGRSISIDSDLKTIHLVDKTDAIIYQGPCSVELFKAICNENDIES